MAKNISSVNIKASQQKVWETLTRPELVKLWQYGSDVITDWKPGSSIKFNSEWEGKTYEQWGEILETEPYQLIRYSLFAPQPGIEDKPENYYIMSYILSVEEGETKLDIIQEDNRPNAVQEPPQGEENSVMMALKKIAEDNQA